MFAAVVHEFGRPPRYESFSDATAESGEVLIHVAAAALNPSTRLLAGGKHYASPKVLPFVCGVDGVGRLPDGTRVFFGVRRPPNGSFVQMTAALRSFCWPVPDGVDDTLAAALPNPGLSSWLPLLHTAHLAPGETVLVLGATGAAGSLAIQIARHLGAGKVIAAGRNEARLEKARSLGADAVITLNAADEEIAKAFATHAADSGVDVILDYLWGHPTELLFDAMTRRGFPATRSQPRLVQIGDSARPALSLSAAALRSTGITITGSGVMPPLDALSKAYKDLMGLAAQGKLHVDVEPVPLSEVEQAWSSNRGRRVVILP